MRSTKPKLFYRKCPICNKLISHVDESNCNKAKKNKSKCKNCRQLWRKSVSKKLYKKIISLHKRGLRIFEIANELNIHRSTVSTCLRENKIKSNYCPDKLIIIDNFGICVSCNKKLELKYFTVRSKGGRQPNCNKCRHKHEKEIMKADKTKLFKYLLNRKQQRAISSKIEFNLNTDYLISLYNEQNGKCFYTGLNLSILFGGPSDPNNLSIDRVDNSKGYLLDNVVLAINRFNKVKSDLSIEEIKKYMPPIYKKIIKKFPQLKVVND